MRAIRPTKTGGPDVLVLTEVPTPAPGDGEVLVRVEAAGVNNIDIVQRAGLEKVPTPIRLGVEGAGKIEALGAGVSGFSVGQLVAWPRTPGSYATYVAVPASELVPVPDGIDAKTAASLMVHGLLGHLLARDAYRLEPGSTCVIFAALMGTAPALSRIAKRCGATVIAVVGDKLGVATAKANGAAVVSISTERGLAATVAEVTGGRGVDVVYDQVGAKTFDTSTAIVRRRGTVVLFGHLGGEKGIRVDPRLLADRGSIYLTRPVLRDFIATREELLARMSDVFAWQKDGSFKINIEGVFPLGAARLAHERLQSKPNAGKIVLLP